MIAIWMDPKSFGIFGGGGRFGRASFGRDGRSGRSGSFGIGGRTGILGSVNPRVGAFGRERLGRDGRRIGLILNLKSGTLILIPRRISERSRIISGQRGNFIIGGLGIIAERILSFQSTVLFR